MGVDFNKIEWANALLSSIARKIQLSKKEYDKAVERYYRIAGILTRHHSLLFGYSPVIYPQGSFRTRSTVSTHDRDEDYDIDLMLELWIAANSDPEQVMELLFRALEAACGELNCESVEKKKRCVTVNYAGMHIDITPAVLTVPQNPRVVTIFDTHPERPPHAIANPEGFAQWFDAQVLPQELLNKRAVRAETYPVPDQEPLEEKPLRLQSVQLLKRYRDMACDAGDYERCPSVLLAKLVALAPKTSVGGLVSDLTSATTYLRNALAVERPYEENPRCSLDILTDRWPKETGAHWRLVRDLDRLLTGLAELTGVGSLSDKQKLLQRLFGERATRAAFDEVSEEFAARAREGSLGAAKGTGAISLTAVSSKGTSNSSPIPSHKFFGS
jgi:Cyclic GMP-AMP synthase DncV-like, nucleotidyltransferase domain